ncbi:uncharacterized protein [Typha angustifolia]|uniref:uncharacterized protein n=1 Tax=Typha angustifolia TaxID=59011 RepID=UPI003C2E775E
MASGVAALPTLLPQIQSKPLKLGLGLGLRFEGCTYHSRFPPLPRSPELRRKTALRGRAIEASLRETGGEGLSPWDDKPYELLLGGRRAYLDEQDVVSFLDPPKELVPIDPASYNPASYLWKKIGDIPEERRHRLLSTVKARLVSRAWELAGMRYQDVKLAKQSSSPLLSLSDKSSASEVWNCRTSKGPLPIPWLNDFKKIIFRGKDGGTYGRIIVGGSIPFGLATSSCPLYFKVKQAVEVMSTEQPCDLAYEFGDGLFDPEIFPKGFPLPVKHPWPFSDQLVFYIRHAGPGVSVGQAWQEGNSLEQVPKKLCNEILMVRDYSVSGC